MEVCFVTGHINEEVIIQWYNKWNQLEAWLSSSLNSVQFTYAYNNKRACQPQNYVNVTKYTIESNNSKYYYKNKH